MALRTYNSDAWGDIEDLKTPEVNNARQSAECAKIYQNNAWEEVWAAIKIMVEKSNNIEYALLQVSDDGTKLDLWKFMDVYDGKTQGTLAGGGTIVFYVDGEWTDPTISFDWAGEMFRYNASSTTWYTASAGSVSLYTVTASGTEATVSAVDKIGDTASGTEGEDNHPGTPSGTYTAQLSGTYTRLGLSIKFNGWNGTYYRASNDLTVSNVKFNNTKIGFPKSSEFDTVPW